MSCTRVAKQVSWVHIDRWKHSAKSMHYTHRETPQRPKNNMRTHICNTKAHTCCCCRWSKSTGLISPLVSPLDPPSLTPPPSDWLLRLLTPFWLDGVVRMVSEADSTIITGTWGQKGVSQVEQNWPGQFQLLSDRTDQVGKLKLSWRRERENSVRIRAYTLSFLKRARGHAQTCPRGHKATPKADTFLCVSPCKCVCLWAYTMD